MVGLLVVVFCIYQFTDLERIYVKKIANLDVVGLLVVVFCIYQFTDLERIYVKKILANLDVVMGKEFGEEIRGIANYWNINVGIIIGMNILAETRRVHSNVHKPD